MRYLEVRRHSLTKKGQARGRGSHLSAGGVALARAIGAEVGPVAYVLTSTMARTIETAVAMGYAVDDAVDVPSGYVPGEVGHHDQWTWPQPYVAYAERLAPGSGLHAVATTVRDLWLRAVDQVPDGATALVISSGGTIEPALVRCLPDADHATWGTAFSHCDGARLTHHAGAFTAIDFRRAPAAGADRQNS
jgi:broad specificity phosphatase PhoE